jgi:hypothetical protein
MKQLLMCLVLVVLAPRGRADPIVNGNFEAGNTGFATAYTFSPGDIGPQQVYDVLNNPFPAHPSATSYGDHTTGSGLMMAVNGSFTPNVLVWGQTVAVAPNADYQFTAYISSWIGTAPAQVDVLFNGTSVGVLVAPDTTGVWVPFTFTWNSGAATSAAIELHNLTTFDVGNDFALDDLSLVGPAAATVPEPATALLALAGGGLLGWAVRRRASRSTRVDA